MKCTKKLTTILLWLLMCSTSALAQGWPQNYGGVMLQAFSWNNFTDTQWTALEAQSADIAQAFDLVWIPNAGNCGSGNQMGYEPVYWFENYNSSFGNKNQLLSMVNAFNTLGVGVIGDVVINHRKSVNGWTGFVSETYNGNTYHLTASDITSDDDSGQTANHLNAGEHLGNADTGTDFNALRDLDHTSTNVQNNVKAYLNMLKNDFGYVGFRYDMVLGYAPEYTALYNTAVSPTYSVGECWDDATTIKDWIDGTAVGGTPTSAAFDFQFRYTVRNAINNSDWTLLAQTNGNDGYPLISSNFNSGNYRRWAVTFVENHDTQDRTAVGGGQKDPIVRDVLAANAYMLAMPGTPCVFMPHWQEYPHEIGAMIAARKAAGVHNQSVYTQASTVSATRYGVRVTGSKAQLFAYVGSGVSNLNSITNFSLILSGENYKYFMSNSANIAWVDAASGTYESEFDATVTAVTSNSSTTTLVYTTDGSEPTASSDQLNNGSTLHIDHNMTLKVALLRNGSIVQGSTCTREYKINEVKRVNVFFAKPDDWTKVHYYTWDASNILIDNASFPGQQITDTKVVKGRTFHYRTFTITGDNPSFKLIVSNGTSSNQTVNYTVSNITGDIYLELGEKSGNKWELNDITEHYGGAFEPYTAIVYFEKPADWSQVNFYGWDSNGNSSLMGGWPGTAITSTTTVGGVTYYYHTFNITAEDYTFQLVFNNGNGTQTVDTPPINSDVYYTTGEIDGSGKYELVEVHDPEHQQQELELNATSLDLEVEQTFTLQATIDGQAAQGVTYTCSDATVATVASDGTVEALKVGTTTITATNGIATGSCNVTVTPGHFTVYVTLGNGVVDSGENWSNVYFHAFKNGNDNPYTDNNTTWPGVKVENTVTYNGVTYYYKTYLKPSNDYKMQIVVNNNNGVQTSNSPVISADTYFTFTAKGSNGRYGLSKVSFDETQITKSIAAIAAMGASAMGNTYIVEPANLTAVYLEETNRVLYCKDDNGYATPVVATGSEIDYITQIAGLMQGPMDQSNWVALKLPEGIEQQALGLVGQKLTNVKGEVSNTLNPEIQLISLPKACDDNAGSYVPNVFSAYNFGNQVQIGANDGKEYFFAQPKPMEIAIITWALWNGTSFESVPYIENEVNHYGFTGAFGSSFSLYEGGTPTLKPNSVYEFVGLVQRQNMPQGSISLNDATPATQFLVFPLTELKELGDINGGVVTAINDIVSETPCVVRRYNIAGQPVAPSTPGLQILKMSDGTVRKVIVK